MFSSLTSFTEGIKRLSLDALQDEEEQQRVQHTTDNNRTESTTGTSTTKVNNNPAPVLPPTASNAPDSRPPRGKRGGQGDHEWDWDHGSTEGIKRRPPRPVERRARGRERLGSSSSSVAATASLVAPGNGNVSKGSCDHVAVGMDVAAAAENAVVATSPLGNFQLAGHSSTSRDEGMHTASPVNILANVEVRAEEGATEGREATAQTLVHAIHHEDKGNSAASALKRTVPDEEVSMVVESVPSCVCNRGVVRWSLHHRV